MTTTSDEVWQLLRELIAAQKETEKGFQETKQRFQETDQRFQETDQRFQETEKLLKQQAQETEQLLKQQAQETDHQIQELSQEIGRLSQQIGRVNQQISALGGKWGRFVENMVAPACETLFLERGISIHEVSQRRRRRLNGDTLEVDVLVENESQILAVEVKSSLGVEDVKEFVKDLGEFKRFFPEYSNKELYGAVAGIEIEDSADKYAFRQGLFVLAQSGETMTILNNESFKPRVWESEGGVV